MKLPFTKLLTYDESLLDMDNIEKLSMINANARYELINAN